MCTFEDPAKGEPYPNHFSSPLYTIGRSPLIKVAFSYLHHKSPCVDLPIPEGPEKQIPP